MSYLLLYHQHSAGCVTIQMSNEYLLKEYYTSKIEKIKTFPTKERSTFLVSSFLFNIYLGINVQMTTVLKYIHLI